MARQNPKRPKPAVRPRKRAVVGACGIEAVQMPASAVALASASPASRCADCGTILRDPIDGPTIHQPGCRPPSPTAFQVVSGPGQPFWRSILTDHYGDFDLGAVLVGVVVVFMCANAGYDTVYLHQHFDAQNFGIGVGAVLAGFAGYKAWDRRQSGTTSYAATTTTGATT